MVSFTTNLPPNYKNWQKDTSKRLPLEITGGLLQHAFYSVATESAETELRLTADYGSKLPKISIGLLT